MDTHGYQPQTLSTSKLSEMKLALYPLKAITSAYLLQREESDETHYLLIAKLVPWLLRALFPEDFSDPILQEKKFFESDKLQIVDWKRADKSLREACKLPNSLIFDRRNIDFGIDYDQQSVKQFTRGDVLLKYGRLLNVIIAIICLIAFPFLFIAATDAIKGNSSQSQTTATTSTASTAESAPDWTAFKKAVNHRVFKNWRVPDSNKSHSATLSFDVAADGHFNNLKVIRSSGNKKFDQSILAAMKKSQPLAPLPKGADSPSTCQFDFFDDVK